MILRNPYKTTHPLPVLKRIACDVSESDWMFLRQLIPDGVLQDIVLSNLFHALISELKEHNPPNPTDSNGLAEIKLKLGTLLRRRSNSPAA
jgi:hypothetical protein